MIRCYKDHEQQQVIILQPNASISWLSSLWVLGFFFVHFVVITAFFVYLGTWVIAPFAGLELLLLATCLYLVNKRVYSQEVITLSESQVKIEKGYRKQQNSWVFERFFCRMYIKHSRHPWQNDKIYLGTHKESVLIGNAVSAKEQKQLKHLLTDYVQSYYQD